MKDKPKKKSGKRHFLSLGRKAMYGERPLTPAKARELVAAAKERGLEFDPALLAWMERQRKKNRAYIEGHGRVLILKILALQARMKDYDARFRRSRLTAEELAGEQLWDGEPNVELTNKEFAALLNEDEKKSESAISRMRTKGKPITLAAAREINRKDDQRTFPKA